MDRSLIRNFSIIAHIDHGKSTLADRILELTGAVDKNHSSDQLLDDMELEKERGITIKASTVRINYRSDDGREYVLNLIDTPGHVDFSYEVSKSLAACEGALLVVDGTQGIEAQTVANFFLAKENKLKIVPVINKIDLASAEVEKVMLQLMEIFHFDENEIMLVSAKSGEGVKEILERIVRVFPPPCGNDEAPLQALVFDSRYDTYRGVFVYLKVINGKLTPDMTVRLMQSRRVYEIEELGVFYNLQHQKVSSLTCGEVGYLLANIRQPSEVVVGDTLTNEANPCDKALPGYRKINPLVFCGIYPVNAADFDNLRDAVEKLKLTDASFTFEPEKSVSFGFGFRCGFLGLLHMEIVHERLQREYDLNLILTLPNVVYRVAKHNKETVEVDSPAHFPLAQEISETEEPFVSVMMIIPVESLDAVCELVKSRRAEYKATEFIGQDRVKLLYDMPLSEIIVDFYDKLKSLTRGYGSVDYEFKDYRKTSIVRMDILVNGTICDAFSTLIFKEKAQSRGRAIVQKLKDLIPKQLFEIAIQAAVGSQILASEKIRSVGKNVTAKCYGGDITRKRKLWEKQKEGKKRMKQFGKVEIPQEAFLEVLKLS